jgi:hypothetical protein
VLKLDSGLRRHISESKSRRRSRASRWNQSL